MADESKAFLALTGIPVGTILAFAGEQNRIPNGWLSCEGQLLSNRTYPKLFDSIGTVWGGSGTPNFYLPDLRGMFLRGVSGTSSVDPDRDKRTSPQEAQSPGNPGKRGNDVGSIQQSEVLKHSHSASASVEKINILGTNRTRDVDEGSDKWNGDPDYGEIKVAVKIDESGGKESRPVNAYVFYIIKVDDLVAA